ncbi:MAG: hypothetical protein ACJ77R_14405 [Gemmatimonadaceae bacterium]
MNRVALFITACILGGLGGAVGSMVGHAFGSAGLWLGGVVGGLLASMATARVALWRHWIVRTQLWPTAFGAAIGFLLAAGIAVKTLSSPIGPIVSTLLIGSGALIGASSPRAKRPEP